MTLLSFYVMGAVARGATWRNSKESNKEVEQRIAICGGTKMLHPSPNPHGRESVLASSLDTTASSKKNSLITEEGPETIKRKKWYWWCCAVDVENTKEWKNGTRTEFQDGIIHTILHCTARRCTAFLRYSYSWLSRRGLNHWYWKQSLEAGISSRQ